MHDSQVMRTISSIENQKKHTEIPKSPLNYFLQLPYKIIECAMLVIGNSRNNSIFLSFGIIGEIPTKISVEVQIVPHPRSKQIKI